MNNPRDNKTDIERARECREQIYTLGVDMIDHHGRRSRFWFREETDRRAFVDLFNSVRAGAAEIIE